MVLCENTLQSRRWPSVGLVLGQRRTRWASIKPALVESLQFTVRLPYNLFFNITKKIFNKEK